MKAPEFSTQIVRCRKEYLAASRARRSLLQERRAFERDLVTGEESFTVAGHCFVCSEQVDFLVDFRFAFEVDGVLTPNWRERLVCPECGLNSRMRATLPLIEELLSPPPESHIYLTEQLSPVYSQITSRWPRTIGSEYLADRVALGKCDPQGVRNEDLTCLTFASETFDFVMSFDVLEHVADFETALAECFRVLKPGGVLFFTVPFRTDLERNLVRSVINDKGEIEHLEPPEYHGDPLRSSGCLAFRHFGWEMLTQIRAVGFADVAAHLYWSKELGYLGGELVAFVAQKAEMTPLQRARRSEPPARRSPMIRLADLRWRSKIFWTRAVRRRGGRRFELCWAPYEDITETLAASGIEIRPHRIDVDDFWRYVEASNYRRNDYYHGGEMRAAQEKWLEHFVSIELMKPQPGEVLIDVASRASPFPDILRAQYETRSYRQDLIYPPGVDGDRIGGNAAELPVEDAFADLLTLHCSFEHFEGDSDSRFIREAARVLKPGGRLCILPLYTSSEYGIYSDPETWAERRVRFEPDATIYLARGWGELHGRFYDGAHFLDRVVANLDGMDLTIYAIENYTEVDPTCYLRFAALLTKPSDGPRAVGD